MRSPIQWIKQVLAGFSTVEDQFYRKYPKLYGILGGGGPTWSGESVSEQSALNHSVVWACVRIISESVAFMPLNMMREVNGEMNPAKKHPMWRALHNAPNSDMTSMAFRETLTAHLVTGGNCYAQILRRSGTGVAYQLRPLVPDQVAVDREKTGSKRLVYVVSESGSSDKSFPVDPEEPQDILHIAGLGHDGIQGYGVIAMARHSIGNAQALERYAGRFFATGGRQPGYVEALQRFAKKEDAIQARADLDKFADNPANLHRWPIFEPGFTFKPASFSPQDSQFIETRTFTPAEICRWFLISPHMVGDLSRATFSNIEHLALQFVKMTLTAWIVRWEQNLWRCVLTPKEQEQGYYFKHNVNGLLRGDFASRMAGYASALQNAHLAPNEVRRLEDLNPYEGGDDYHLQLNMQTNNSDGKPTSSQAAAVMKLGTAKKEYVQ